MDINRVLLSGRLGSEPGPKCFSLASNGLKWIDKTGKPHQTTCFIEVSYKGKLAHQCSVLKKSDAVYVEGVLMQNPTDKMHWVRAEKITFLKEL